jgi:hypothetical protein
MGRLFFYLSHLLPFNSLGATGASTIPSCVRVLAAGEGCDDIATYWTASIMRARNRQSGAAAYGQKLEISTLESKNILKLLFEYSGKQKFP